MKYFLCSVCGNLIEMVDDAGNTPSCCGRTMQRLDVAVTDGNPTVHVPYIIFHAQKENADVRKVTIQVGEQMHPMESVHHIAWVTLETSCCVHRARLYPGERPEATFYLQPGEEIRRVYAYCNLHGLWMKEIDGE